MLLRPNQASPRPGRLHVSDIDTRLVAADYLIIWQKALASNCSFWEQLPGWRRAQREHTHILLHTHTHTGTQWSNKALRKEHTQTQADETKYSDYITKRTAVAGQNWYCFLRDEKAWIVSLGNNIATARSVHAAVLSCMDSFVKPVSICSRTLFRQQIIFHAYMFVPEMSFSRNKSPENVCYSIANWLAGLTWRCGIHPGNKSVNSRHRHVYAEQIHGATKGF